MTVIQGKVAVVTGGASGIGRALATQFVQRGATVALADIQLSAATEVAEQIGATPFAVDVSRRESVEQLAADVLASLGPVGILANNAGVASTAPLVEMTDADWAWLLGVNVMGITHGVTAFLPQLRETKGHIINTGSMSGLQAKPGTGGYGTTKFAMTAYTEVLAEELAPEGIGVTLLAPGPVRTGLGFSSRNRPEGSAGALQDKDLSAGDGGGLRWADPAEVGRIAVAAIEADRFYAITHPEWLSGVAERHRAIEASFAI
jgi:NAD(P)-dependent dehydrogenase (short-subunit alcohol dehydrogenase family)